MPTYQEIMGLVGFKSKNAVYKLVKKLIALDVIGQDSSGRLVPKNLIGEVPMLGLVEAGIPSVAEAMYSDTISLDSYLINQPDGTYLLEVKGDSMIDAGIREKDLVVAVRAGSPGVGNAKVGDIVIAEVDGGWTMKYLRKDKSGRMYLEPANKKYKPIYPEQELNIAGIVKGVVRKY
jgi:SOS-response transcriptional repressor LexA